MLFSRIDSRQYAALRIVFGALTFLTLLGLLPESSFQFSDSGWFPLRSALEVTAIREWTFLHCITSVQGVKAFFLFLLIASLGMTVGFYSRLSTLICFLGLVSLHSRNWLITYGGDAVLRLVLFYLAMAPIGKAWSIDALLIRMKRKDRDVTAGKQLSGGSEHRPHLVEVWPLRLLQLQIVLIYFTTGMAKVHGQAWIDGSALGLVLLNPLFARGDFSFIQGSPIIASISAGMSYVVLAWEISFPVLVLFRPTRYLALAVGVAMHLGIILFLRIHWFGYIMIATYLAFLSPRLFRAIEIKIRRMFRPIFLSRPIEVTYDDSNVFCRHLVVFLSVLDSFRRLRFIPVSRSNRDLTSILMAGEVGGKVTKAGFGALELMGKSIPLLWPLLPLCQLPRFRNTASHLFQHFMEKGNAFTRPR